MNSSNMVISTESSTNSILIISILSIYATFGILLFYNNNKNKNQLYYCSDGISRTIKQITHDQTYIKFTYIKKSNINIVNKYLCSDSVYRTIPEIISILNPYEIAQSFEYRGHIYKIELCRHNHLCGYINIDGELPYEGHGGITGNSGDFQGFDCANSMDYWLGDVFDTRLENFDTRSKSKSKSKSRNRSFKTPDFVHSECKKMIDEYLDMPIFIII